MKIRSWRALLAAVGLVGAAVLAASALAASVSAAPATGLRLYVLDCGTLIYDRPEDYGLKREEVATSNMAVTCYLIVHPKGTLLFDTGLSDRLVGRPVWEHVIDGYGQLKFTTLLGELADIGITPEKITYLALSHGDFDHVANANDYAASVWLTPDAERDAMFSPQVPASDRQPYQALERARTVSYRGDHDVFGDGSVVLKATPGHTPGHQSLYVRLEHTGGVVLSGDLYHYPEERTLNRLPPEEVARGTPASRAAMEDFLRQTHSQLWIGHSIAFYKGARKSPAWYD